MWFGADLNLSSSCHAELSTAELGLRCDAELGPQPALSLGGTGPEPELCFGRSLSCDATKLSPGLSWCSASMSAIKGEQEKRSWDMRNGT